MRRVFLLAALLGLVVMPALAQDPVKVDPKHYKVVFENDQMRVLRVHYGLKEKSVMHEHPDSVATFLGDVKVKFTAPDGKSEEKTGKLGDTMFLPAGKHLPENIGDKPVEVVVVELKGKAPAKPAAMPAKKGK